MNVFDLGKIIKTKRKEKGLTRDQLAAKAHISPYEIEEWEKGYSYPSLNSAVSVIKELGMSLQLVENGKPFPDGI
ncbi:MAG: helix-turn-helix domain-containing protein [Bacteroidales bacterium]|nr:helix-turn-helix domain-containing protein [Bacteroidales bacterium]